MFANSSNVFSGWWHANTRRSTHPASIIREISLGMRRISQGVINNYLINKDECGSQQLRAAS